MNNIDEFGNNLDYIPGRVWYGHERCVNATVTIEGPDTSYRCLLDPNDTWNGYAKPLFDIKTFKQFQADLNAYSRSFGGGTEDDYNHVMTYETVRMTIDTFYRPTGYCFVVSNPQDILQGSIVLLVDLKATYEYPGFVNVQHDGLSYDIGCANGAFGYDVTDIATGEVLSDEHEDTLPLTATVEEFVDFVRRVVA